MIFTIYAKDDDMTYIMEDKTVNKEKYLSVVGFYFGKPNEADTKEYTGSLTAKFPID